MDSQHRPTIEQAVELVRARQLSARELKDAYRARIER